MPRKIGCTIVLRGLSQPTYLAGDSEYSLRENLMNLKRITWFAVYIAYHLRMEQAFLSDLLAVAEIPYLHKDGQMLMSFSRRQRALTELSPYDLVKLSSDVAEQSAGSTPQSKSYQFITQISPHTDGDSEDYDDDQDDICLSSDSMFPRTASSANQLRKSAHLARMLTIKGKQRFWKIARQKGLSVQLDGEDIGPMNVDKAPQHQPRRGNLITISQPLESHLLPGWRGLDRSSVGVLFSQKTERRKTDEFDQQYSFKRSKSLKLPQRAASLTDSEHPGIIKQKSLGAKFVNTLSQVRESIQQSQLFKSPRGGLEDVTYSNSARESLYASGLIPEHSSRSVGDVSVDGLKQQFEEFAHDDQTQEIQGRLASGCPDHFDLSLYGGTDIDDDNLNSSFYRNKESQSESNLRGQMDTSLRVYQLQTLAVCESVRDVSRGIENVYPDLHLYSFYREDWTLHHWLFELMGGDRPIVHSFCMGELKIEFQLEFLPKEDYLEPDSLWFWARPVVLQPEIQRLSKRIEVSQLSKNISFAFVLNLFFRAKRLKLFDLNLIEGYTYYFGSYNKVVRLRRTYFQPLVLRLPSLSVKYDQEVHREKFQEEKYKIQQVSCVVLKQVQENIQRQISWLERKGSAAMDQILQLRNLMSDVEDKEAKLIAGINVVGLEELVRDPSVGITDTEESLSQQLVKIQGKTDGFLPSGNNEYHQLVGESANYRWLGDMMKWRKKLSGFWWILAQDARESIQQMEDIVGNQEVDRSYRHLQRKDSFDSGKQNMDVGRYSNPGTPQILSPTASVQDPEEYSTNIPSSPPGYSANFDSSFELDRKDTAMINGGEEGEENEEYGMDPSPFAQTSGDFQSFSPKASPTIRTTSQNQGQENDNIPAQTNQRTLTLSEWDIDMSQTVEDLQSLPSLRERNVVKNQSFDNILHLASGFQRQATMAGSDSILDNFGLDDNTAFSQEQYYHRHTHSQGSIVVGTDFVQSSVFQEATMSQQVPRNFSLNSLRSFGAVQQPQPPYAVTSNILSGFQGRVQSGEEHQNRSRRVSRRYSVISGLKKLNKYDPAIDLPQWEGYREGNVGPGELMGFTSHKLQQQEGGSIPVFDSQASSFVAYLLSSFSYKFELFNSREHLLKLAEEMASTADQVEDEVYDDDSDSEDKESVDKQSLVNQSGHSLGRAHLQFQHSSSLQGFDAASLQSYTQTGTITAASSAKFPPLLLNTELDRSLYVMRYPKDEQITVSLSETACRGAAIQYGKEVTITAFYAPQFAELRKFCVPSEESYIQSLMRSETFNAEGGKSKAKFARTSDDRFLIKQILDRESYITSMLPKYLAYMADTLELRSESQNQKTDDVDGTSDLHSTQNTIGNTCLAKILGVYQVRTESGGKDSNFVFIVSENIFYSCLAVHNIAYDLKGLFHNRRKNHSRTPSSGVVTPPDNPTDVAQDYVVVGDPTQQLTSQGGGQQNRIVHIGLDENLRDAVLNEPLMLEMSCYTQLQSALERDTQFLARNKIIDYSLLLAKAVQNDQQPFIVVGIVDYLQPYTMKKKIESQLKTIKNKMLVGGEQPTIVSPDKYRRRFLDGILQLLTQIPASNEIAQKSSTMDTAGSSQDPQQEKKQKTKPALSNTYAGIQSEGRQARENLTQKLRNLANLSKDNEQGDVSQDDAANLQSPFLRQLNKF
eukprot:TRINITY_DN2606_c0_g3_i1.p1 TRINITY_DN2606_c0_g3~~TRINITY_DN2606_c0_g3_i1.p1  ORF type:complete len:1797 (-),score=144.27 TRINITY_DN2606_c0_g3_i1:334-5337(-)